MTADQCWRVPIASAADARVDLRPGQANLVIEGEARTQRVIARLIVERIGLDAQAPGDDPVEAVENLVRVLR